MEKENNLHIIKLTDTNYIRVMENAIQLGLPVILENIAEDIDATLGNNVTPKFFLKLKNVVQIYNIAIHFLISQNLFS